MGERVRRLGSLDLWAMATPVVAVMRNLVHLRALILEVCRVFDVPLEKLLSRNEGTRFMAHVLEARYACVYVAKESGIWMNKEILRELGYSESRLAVKHACDKVIDRAKVDLDYMQKIRQLQRDLSQGRIYERRTLPVPRVDGSALRLRRGKPAKWVERREKEALSRDLERAAFAALERRLGGEDPDDDGEFHILRQKRML